MLVLTAELVIDGAEPRELKLLGARAALVAVSLGDEALDGAGECGGFAGGLRLGADDVLLGRLSDWLAVKLPDRFSAWLGLNVCVECGALQQLDHDDHSSR